MPGHASHAACSGIVYNSAQHLALFVILGWRDRGPPRCWRKEAGMRHPQRSEDVFQAILVLRYSRHAFDQRTQDNKIYIAVEKMGPRRYDRRFGESHGKRGIASLPRLS